ncbi:MAG: hypothetical protein J5I98_26415 [Phaeodactylibacter sp.]|nr:hypothetical protein [Phaeodactylibacter sp.]
MATDGPKIIDGDLAHDTYWGIMDKYDVDFERFEDVFVNLDEHCKTFRIEKVPVKLLVED